MTTSNGVGTTGSWSGIEAFGERNAVNNSEM
jgi:hypothetical protein